MCTKTIREFGVCLAVTSGLVLAQAPPAAPVAFEVAAIRVAPPIAELMEQIRTGKAKVGMTMEGNRIDFGFVSLADLIGKAYSVKPYQVQGPNWMAQQRFDIQATIPNGVSKDRVPEMLQALLAACFGITTHKEKRDQPIYALIVGKNGLKLTEAEPEKALSDSANRPNGGTQGFPLKVTRDGPNGVTVQSGTTRISGGPDGSRMEFHKITMPAFANVLSLYVDRPITDMTGLTGEYQVALDISPEDMRQAAQRTQQQMAQLGLPPLLLHQQPEANPAEAPAPAGGSLFTAVEKLGLKLDPRKAPGEVLVIDHIEKTPTEN